MKRILITKFACLALITSCNIANPPIVAEVNESPVTYCNPLNLNYRFQIIPKTKGVREAADPVMTKFNDKYYLFASKSEGYWHSTNLNDWTYVQVKDSVLPIELYAPATFTHGQYIYYVGSTHGSSTLYRSNDTDNGKWEAVKDIMSYWDPAFFIEGDNLYLYYGCSPELPIYATVLNLNTFESKGKEIVCFNSNKEKYGWERPGEVNELGRRPYIEGAWMTKHNDKYYL